MEKFYLTTPIYYVNAPPHLGHAYADLAADVVARWRRGRGDKTFFLTGTDEHGAKIVRAAAGAGKPVEEFVALQRRKFQKLLTALNISNDAFIYTSSQARHWPGARAMWERLKNSGDLYKAKYKGLYCVGHEAFVTEKDLLGGKCADHNQEPEVIEEENYFFRLSKYASRIEDAVASDTLQILPVSRKNEVLAFLKEGISDISFSRPSRDISWGIPVPHDPEHTIYVWADALSNYISALGYGSPDDKNFTTFWPADLHIIGKDILRFHAIIWPGILFSSGLPLPKCLFVHGMILFGGQKMSKTLGNVADPFSLIERYGRDPFRFFLMREIPFGGDGDFTEERFALVYEGSLAHGLGNLVERVSRMVQKYFPRGLQKPTEDMLKTFPTKRKPGESIRLDVYFGEIAKRYENAMAKLELTQAITIIWDFFSYLDGYIQDYVPYSLFKKDPKGTEVVLWNLARSLRSSARLLEPFMPETASKIENIFIADGNRLTSKDHEPLFPSHKTG